MEMSHIELMSALKYLLQHQNVVRHPIDAAIIQAKRAAARGNKPGSRHRVTTCKERHVVALGEPIPR